jgi:ATP/maltotriose-dependent transcriptional regulator MalT
MPKQKNIARDISNVHSVRIGDETHHHYAETKLSKELTLNIPKTHPDDIIGREDDLQSLRDLLCNDKRVVVVNGLGGIGKTTLVQVYVSKYYDDYEHIAWVTQNSDGRQASCFISHTSSSLSLLILNTVFK